MTTEEFVKHINSKKKEVETLKEKISEIESSYRKEVREYALEIAKFKPGTAVIYTEEKYKVPRKYIINEVWGYINRKNDGTDEFKVQYHMATSNGHEPAGGWSIEEKHLKAYE